jgi:hypothetical protein
MISRRKITNTYPKIVTPRELDLRRKVGVGQNKGFTLCFIHFCAALFLTISIYFSVIGRNNYKMSKWHPH